MTETNTPNQTGEIDYIGDSLESLYRRLLPSAIGSLLTSTVASLIDVVILSYFLGPEMLAVVGLCMPVYMLVNTLGMLISSGAATLYAQYLGEGNREEAHKYFSLSIIHMLLCALFLTAIGLFFTKDVVTLLGANAAIIEATESYAHILFLFMIPLMLYVQLLFFVRIDGDPVRTLAATFSCAVTNLALDVLFVGSLGLGVRGAAMATCLAYTIGMAVNLTHFLSPKNSLTFRKDCLTSSGLRMWRAGIPLAASQLGMTVSTQVFNNIVIRVGNENYVALYAVITQLSMISMAIYDGIGQAAQPILAAAFGAGKRDRLDLAFRRGIQLEIIGTLILGGIYFLAAGQIAGLFSIKSGDLLALSLSGIRCYALSIPFMGMNSIIMYYFQAQEKTAEATAISLISGSLILIAALIILIFIFGERGIWLSWVTAQLLALLISFILFSKRRVSK